MNCKIFMQLTVIHLKKEKHGKNVFLQFQMLLRIFSKKFLKLAEFLFVTKLKHFFVKSKKFMADLKF